MITKKLTILNKLGLHARAAAKVVSTANQFESTIIITKDGKNADARSIMKLLMLSASQGSSIRVEIDGADQNDAMESIERLFNNKFDEQK
ncbi:MAG: HPr family phosphocarrier protein [Pseudomonadota bacterium]|jgi:phosphocarrier protein|nr:HPr family phosphocarrier protein [Pseudomonadota bacterium]|tara:strand:- start:1610 stop:1879 length:270 start_codon:yes stop_codon:yes gene_type:complete